MDLPTLVGRVDCTLGDGTNWMEVPTLPLSILQRCCAPDPAALPVTGNLSGDVTSICGMVTLVYGLSDPAGSATAFATTPSTRARP